MSDCDIQVIKLGGSLLDLPDLVDRLREYKRDTARERSLLVVGGGLAADAVREFDARHKLGEEQGHWRAVHAMQLNAHMLACVFKDCQLVESRAACDAVWSQGKIALVDPLAWLTLEHQRGIVTPHRWSFTSDSIAAHVATQVGATLLTLLKSTLPTVDSSADGSRCDLVDAAAQAVVDGDFVAACAGVPHVELVNWRERPWKCCTMR